MLKEKKTFKIIFKNNNNQMLNNKKLIKLNNKYYKMCQFNHNQINLNK